MTVYKEPDEQVLAREIVSAGHSRLKDPAIRERYHVDQFGEFWTFTPEELDQLTTARELIAAYLRRHDPLRPLCLAVFGAPGSGKSFAVKQIVKSLRDERATTDATKSTAAPTGDAKTFNIAPMVEVNLTQIGSTSKLAKILLCAREDAAEAVPLVFFDEFDTEHDGAPWGWLAWFLAPMQDGNFRVGGRSITLRRAIYVFAGGTASRFEEFGRSDPQRFRVAKGPDFQSRLRGFIDIAGPNADTRRSLRRAVLLRSQLDDRGIHPDLLGAMLAVGRYRHGARSIGALIEMMKTTDELKLESLPPAHVRAMHADRGPLDDQVIGGMVGMSGGGGERGNFGPTWEMTTRSLLLDGAKIAFGGTGGQDLDNLLIQLGTTMPARLEPVPKEKQPPPWVRFVAQQTKDTTPDVWQESPTVCEVSVSDAELERWKAVDPHVRERLTSSLLCFRMRYAMSLACVARFALSGSLQPRTAKTAEFPGRFPGVVEELMLALAMGQPVYIAGGFKGGAHWAGTLLGLGESWRGRPQEWPASELVPPELLRDADELFRPPPHTSLPLSRAELVAFLEEHALGGPRWPNNGLSPAENRQLFRETIPDKVAELVRRGLRRRFEGGDQPVR